MQTGFVTGKNEGWKAPIIILGEYVCCRGEYDSIAVVPKHRATWQVNVEAIEQRADKS